MNQPCFEKNLPLNGIGWWFISSQSMFSILTSPATFQRLPQGKQAIQVQLHSEKIQSVLGEGPTNLSLALCSEFQDFIKNIMTFYVSDIPITIDNNIIILFIAKKE